MRTTIDIDDDVLNAAKALATRQKVSVGRVLSDLVRKALVGPSDGAPTPSSTGFARFPNHGQVITPEFIRQLDEQSE